MPVERFRSYLKHWSKEKLCRLNRYRAVDLWATKKCERQGLAADAKLKRRILEEQIVKGIRFPTTKQEDFASVALNSKILTKDEIVNIIQYFNSVSISHVGFSETKRSVYSGEIQRCCRFASLSDRGLRYDALCCVALSL